VYTEGRVNPIYGPGPNTRNACRTLLDRRR
jgi:hypothetical protein